MSGVGRGRGWLNLNKNSCSNSVPGGGTVRSPGQLTSPLTSPIMPAQKQVGLDGPPQPPIPDNSSNNYVDSVEDFSELVNNLKHLNVNDDGILLNQKLKFIVEEWNEICKNGDDVQKSFDAIFQACLNDSELASKLVLMIASRSFKTQKIHDQKIRSLFLKQLQNTFENIQQLQSSNPIVFRNATQLLGDCYSMCRATSASQFSMLVAPIITCLQMLLESGKPIDLKLFTNQLHLNGAALKEKAPKEFSALLNSVRYQLTVAKNNLPGESKLWLMLALDFANNRFGLLPSEVQKFYQEKLGAESVITLFQNPNHGTLSIQTASNNYNTLDNYMSNVNVLQMSSTTNSTQLEQEKRSSPPQQEQYVNNISISQNTTTTNSTNFHHTDSSQNSIRRETSNPKPPAAGRPILGAGAGLMKNKLHDDAGVTGWRVEDNMKDWSNNRKLPVKKQLSGNDITKSMLSQSNRNKGWEHDDRFETDYS